VGGGRWEVGGGKVKKILAIIGYQDNNNIKTNLIFIHLAHESHRRRP
jgi:hypothetical protein